MIKMEADMIKMEADMIKVGADVVRFELLKLSYSLRPLVEIS